MKLLGIDPGKTTGLCSVRFDTRAGNRTVTMLDARAVRFEDLPLLLREGYGTGVSAVILEGWEVQGRAIDSNCRYAMETIGAVRMWAEFRYIPVVEVFSSRWKPSFSRGYDLVQVPLEVKARKPERPLAHAAYHRLKHWPQPLVDIKEPERGHVLNALGLALYGEHVWHGETILKANHV